MGIACSEELYAYYYDLVVIFSRNTAELFGLESLESNGVFVDELGNLILDVVNALTEKVGLEKICDYKLVLKYFDSPSNLFVQPHLPHALVVSSAKNLCSIVVLDDYTHSITIRYGLYNSFWASKMFAGLQKDPPLTNASSVLN